MTGGSELTYTGIVLAGGRSSRMGVDKGLIEWQGKRLVEYSLQAMVPFCSEVIISTNNEAYCSFGHNLVKDEFKDIGPMGGLHAGLKATQTDHNIVLSCDMPFVDEEIIRMLLKRSTGFQSVVPVIDGQSIPVCAYYHKSALDLIEKEIAKGLYKMKLLLHQLKTAELEIKDAVNREKLRNINTLADLEGLWQP